MKRMDLLRTAWIGFYTQTGAELAKQRQKAAVEYYHNLLTEVSEGYEQGNKELLKFMAV